MNKRNLAAFLWFLVGWQAGGVLVGLLALPELLAFAPGVVLAIVVRWDPAGWFTARPSKGPQIVPINAYAAALDKQRDTYLDKRVDHWPVVDTDSTGR